MFEVYITSRSACGAAVTATSTPTRLRILVGASRQLCQYGHSGNEIDQAVAALSRHREPPVSTVFFRRAPQYPAARDLSPCSMPSARSGASRPTRKSLPKPIRTRSTSITSRASCRRPPVFFLRHATRRAARAQTPTARIRRPTAVGVNGEQGWAALQRGFDLRRSGRALTIGAPRVTTAIDLGVNHISAYALTVEPTTKMGRQIAAGTLPKPNDDDEAANTRSLTTCSPPPASNGMRSPTGLARIRKPAQPRLLAQR